MKARVALEGYLVKDDVVDCLGMEIIEADLVHEFGPEPDGIGILCLLAGNKGSGEQECDKYLFHIGCILERKFLIASVEFVHSLPCRMTHGGRVVGRIAYPPAVAVPDLGNHMANDAG